MRTFSKWRGVPTEYFSYYLVHSLFSVGIVFFSYEQKAKSGVGDTRGASGAAAGAAAAEDRDDEALADQRGGAVRPAIQN